MDVEGNFGIAVRNGDLAFGLTTSGLSLHAGLDDPLADGASACTAPSMKAIVGKQLYQDTFVAGSYDFKLRKPELSICWTGEAKKTERATLCLLADPIHRALKVAAAVSFQGTEWRNTVYNEERDLLEDPKDDGGRHCFWVRHEARWRNPLHRTQVGASFDIGRLINYVCDQVDYKIEPKLPPSLWAIPGSQWFYNLLVPAEDEDQYRHRIRGWNLDLTHEFGHRGPLLAICKTLPRSLGALSVSYDLHSKEAGVEMAVGDMGVLKVGAKISKEGEFSGRGWKRPALYCHVEPLGLLSMVEDGWKLW